jgi:hypothetical protein
LSPIIKVENLGKSYIIDHEQRESYTALRDVIAKNAKKIFSFPTWFALMSCFIFCDTQFGNQPILP